MLAEAQVADLDFNTILVDTQVYRGNVTNNITIVTNPGLRRLGAVLGLTMSALVPKAVCATLATPATVPTIVHIADVAGVVKDKSLIYIDLHEGHFRLRV